MGWTTCADCSSLGLDKWVGDPQLERPDNICASCGGPWPLRESIMKEDGNPNILKYFAYGHLPEPLKSVSKKFHDAAHYSLHGGKNLPILADLMASIHDMMQITVDRHELQVSLDKVCKAFSSNNNDGSQPSTLRLLLEAKDAAVRSFIK